jgi:hypothetical protein
MNKSAFKALRSKYRAIRESGSSKQDRIKSFSDQQDAFCNDADFNFRKCRKPDARTGIVSIRVANKLDFPAWCFESPKFN